MLDVCGKMPIPEWTHLFWVTSSPCLHPRTPSSLTTWSRRQVTPLSSTRVPWAPSTSCGGLVGSSRIRRGRPSVTGRKDWNTIYASQYHVRYPIGNSSGATRYATVVTRFLFFVFKIMTSILFANSFVIRSHMHMCDVINILFIFFWNKVYRNLPNFPTEDTFLLADFLRLP